jgi:alpha-tubulin suppressor-like RCC1 family protein
VLALKRDGSLWAWGANGSGQLGDGSFKASRVPVPTGLIGISRVRAGGNQSFAISSRRAIYSFGESGDGQLGLGDAISTDIGVPSAVARAVTDATAGDRTALLLGVNGLVSSAGANESGSLGDGGTSARKIFGAVNVLSNVVALDSGGRSFSVAIAADGTTYVWGDNTTKHFANSTIAAAGTGTPTAVPNFDAIP